jgi:hypothetical protein
MFSILQTHLKLPFTDITFENFTNVPLPIDWRKLFIS